MADNSNNSKPKSFVLGVDKFTLNDKGEILCNELPTTTSMMGGKKVLIDHYGRWWSMPRIKAGLKLK